MGTETYQPEQWITGSDPVATTVGTIATGQTIAQYTPMGQKTTTGEFHTWAPGATDGTQNATRIAPFAIDTTGGATDKQLIKAGTFNPELVVWGAATAVQKLLAFTGTPISVQALR